MRGLRRPASSAFAVTAATSLAALFAHAAPMTGYKLIGHPNIPIETLDRQFVEDAFLKKTTTWPGGGPIRPVDLAGDSPARRQFSLDVLRRPVDAIRSYWQQRIFAGRELPPPELESDDAVVKFVLRNRGALGYVSDGTTLNGAKVLTVR
jgi:hypothetical protein